MICSSFSACSVSFVVQLAAPVAPRQQPLDLRDGLDEEAQVLPPKPAQTGLAGM
jgi:hypothetical protein